MPSALTRNAALTVYWAMVIVPVAFLALVLALAERPQAPHLTELFFWAAVAASALDVTLSRLLPPRLRPASSDPTTVALTRLLVAWALCEAAALFPVVAYLLTGDPRLVGVFAVDLLALVLLFPSPGRIESLAPARDLAAPLARRVR